MEDSILTEIARKDLQEIAGNFVEAGIDNLMDECILQNIPIISTLKRCVSAIQNIKDNFFAKKLLKFLLELKDIPHEKRAEFYDNVVDYGANYKKVGDTILLLIDKIDSDEKAVIIGRLMRSCIEDKISVDDFFRLSSFVEKAYLTDLLQLSYHKNANHLPRLTKEQLYTIGLLKISIRNIDRSFSRREKNTQRSKAHENKNLSSKDFSPVSQTSYAYNIFGETLRMFGF